ncbi:hypothetical protein HMPREF7215_0240 [Pyramidobacter piscolens W5455]|uniref:DUF340 domain-containing protein n=1 Tax=Pyramidobacter piscolens W5455 TaxID=352165 RepID=A0ABM9ZU27_9BACT|nr:MULTISPECIES: hypothetical protein [Pyramidobacter]EFB90407.1 hypothetical protein HMPREF7215_0240 [Pyramidobacter piscolens W5455]RKJ80510.1 hypothetical protein D7D26_02765 [Pyramidobacter sp. CG50-2]
MNLVAKTLNQLKVLVLLSAAVLITHYAAIGQKLNLVNAIIGMIIIVAISIVSVKIKEALPLKIPAFAWASLISMLLTIPASPVGPYILQMTKQITTGEIGTVILAVAGISIGTRIDDVKKLSWRIILVAIVVFCGTFFGSALIAQLIMKVQGLI